MNESAISIEEWNPRKHPKPTRLGHHATPTGTMAEAVISKAQIKEQVVTVPVGVSCEGLTEGIYRRARANGKSAHIVWLSEFSFAVWVADEPARKRASR